MHGFSNNHILKFFPMLMIASASMVSATEVTPTNDALSALANEIQWLQEETYVTTATKTYESISKSGSSVSVVTAREIKNMGARNLMDVLKRVPGFDINNTNINIPSITVRGVKTDSSEKILFLINGHAVNNNLVNGGATWGYGNFQVDHIQRVEIVRGPGSALYGANAFVAVVNIISRTAENINGHEVTIGGGKYNTKKLNIASGGDEGPIRYSLNYNGLFSDGLNEPLDPATNSGRVDGWERRNDFSFNIGFDHYQLQGNYIKRNAGPFVGIANTLNDESEQEYIDYFLELSGKGEIANHLSLQTKLYLDHFEANNFWELFPEGFPGFGGGAFPDGALGSPTVKNEKIGGELQFEYRFHERNKLLSGITFEHQTQYDVKHIANFDPTSPTFDPQPVYEDVSDKWNWNGSHRRDISAIYLQDIWDITDELRLIVGARRDDYSDFGSSVNPRSSITWEAAKNYHLTAAYGKAFRAPNFGELYNINNPSIIGNPNLDPEEIETYEIKLNANITRRLNIGLTGYKNNISDLINQVGTTSKNVGKLEVKGLEFEISSRGRDGSSIDINYAYQYPKNKITDSRAADIPMHKANAAYQYRHSKQLGAYIGLTYRGKQKRSLPNSSDIKEHSTLDVAANWRNAANNFEISASIFNLLGEDYIDPSAALPSGLPTPNRNFMVEASYKL